MKRIIFVLVGCLLFSYSSMNAQVAVGLETDFSLYQWYKRPSNISNPESSSGQLLAFPSIGPKVWFGDWEDWTISIEGKIDYAPFSFEMNDEGGFGALSFPFIIKGNFSPFGYGSEDNGTTKIGIGTGMQWTKTELYGRPDFLKGTKNPFFITYVAELSCQLIIGKYEEGVALILFTRAGWGKYQARTFSLGIKINYRYITN